MSEPAQQISDIIVDAYGKELPMQLEDYLDFQGPDVVRIKGHRIGLEHIVERYQEGYSPEEIGLDFPGLSLEKIYGVIAYYLHNQADVDAYIERVNARAEAAYQDWAANPSPASLRLRRIKEQREQYRKSA
jgi:uncharacterized protein (DUF433 family)